MEFRFTVSIPDMLEDKVHISEPFVNYSVRGDPLSYGVNLTLSELHLTKTCKVRDVHLLSAKIEETLASWEQRYKRHVDQQNKERTAHSVEEQNRLVREELEGLENILMHTLSVDDTVDWSSLRRKEEFQLSKNSLITDEKLRSFISFDKCGKPKGVFKSKLPMKPQRDGVAQQFGWFTRIFKKNLVEDELNKQIAEWESLISKVKKTLTNAAKQFDARKAVYIAQQQEENAAVDRMEQSYRSGDRKAVEEYCDLVLQSSEYSDRFPQSFDIEYRTDSHIIVLDYHLPSIDDLPTIESYRFIKTRNEVAQKEISAARRKKLFESVIYQVCIRTIHELFEADTIDAIEAVAFNGIVTHVNPATGKEETKTILSILANKEEFLDFDLAKIDPKATFKHLKGISGAALVDLTPVQPILQLEKTDRRFVDSKAIAESLDSTLNLAAMDWEDFEHLVRELFEQEFAVNGGEVKVTQASSDGGVDAIAFDPDPIRGGRIIIQAKRYTNIVGVAAVRDLYGTVVNEGATKGILVTTSNYGRDSFDFAKDKPLTLLNGQNLLYLLEKHGHNARIDIADAKRVLKARE